MCHWLIFYGHHGWKAWGCFKPHLSSLEQYAQHTLTPEKRHSIIETVFFINYFGNKNGFKIIFKKIVHISLCKYSTKGKVAIRSFVCATLVVNIQLSWCKLLANGKACHFFWCRKYTKLNIMTCCFIVLHENKYSSKCHSGQVHFYNKSLSFLYIFK